MIIEVLSSGPAETNAYLLACPQTRQAALIDTPFDCSSWVLRRVEELSLNLGKILLTHSHWDHIAEAALLKERFKAPVYIHHEDAGNLEVPGSDRLPLWKPVEGTKPDVFLKEEDVITVGNLLVKVIHTPGHTPGGVCFYLPKEKVLFSGDTLFRGTIGNLSFPTSRPALMWESLKKLANLPGETVVYPGHGEPTTIGKEQWIANAQERF